MKEINTFWIKPEPRPAKRRPRVIQALGFALLLLLLLLVLGVL